MNATLLQPTCSECHCVWGVEGSWKRPSQKGIFIILTSIFLNFLQEPTSRYWALVHLIKLCQNNGPKTLLSAFSNQLLLIMVWLYFPSLVRPVEAYHSIIRYTSIYSSSEWFGGAASLWIWDLSDCGTFGKQESSAMWFCLFVRGYSLQQFWRRYGNRHFDFSTIVFKKRIILKPLMKVPHIRPIMMPSKVCCPKTLHDQQQYPVKCVVWGPS
jgi:hypothetical protein